MARWTRAALRALLMAVTPFRPVFPALVLLLTAATATAQFTPTVELGGRQVTLSWSSPFPGTTELAWGPTSAPAFTGYPNRFTAPGTGNAHSATLRRLAPGTWFVRARTGSTESRELEVVVPSTDGTPLADWAFDGTVNALLRHGSSWYVGGDFSSVGQTTGGGVPTLADGGIPRHFPEVAGQVFAVEADGLGGFYLGGSFTSVGGLPRSNVAHLFPDLGVDPLWNPGCNGPVYAIKSGPFGSVFVAGLFTRVSGQARGPLVEIGPTGSGYSSLSYLRRFPIDTLKIDQSFVQEIDGDAGNGIVSAVIAMGVSLNHRVVAEGIETIPQLAFLQQHACEEGQGYLFSPPVTAEVLGKMLPRAA